MLTAGFMGYTQKGQNMEILYTSGDVHKAIKNIFSLPCKRRVAVVAYLGINAENFLPNPKGIEIICSPEPGATSPDAIRNLINRGAKIQFSNGLHSKVYWSDKGCIITSANISHRALGDAPQREIGVLVKKNVVDIERIISETEPYDVTQALMDKLESQDRKIKKSVGLKYNKKEKTQFANWHESPYRKPWKIGWWSDSELETSKNAIERSVKDYNKKDPVNVLNTSKNQVVSHDWLLCFEISANKIKNIEWMYVDFVVPVSPEDLNAFEKDYPYQAIQVHKLSQYPIPPFAITPEFRKIFKKAVIEFGIEKIEQSKSLKPKKKLLDLAYAFASRQ